MASTSSGRPPPTAADIELTKLYVDDMLSLSQIAGKLGMSISTVRKRLLDAGTELRSRAAGIRLAGPRLATSRRGKKRQFTAEWKSNLSKAMLSRGELHAAGRSLKPSGYVEITQGENKGRGEHAVVAEKKLGRQLLRGELVHHRDENRANNDPDNLEVMTRGEHARLHALERAQSIGRDCKGRFQKVNISAGGSDGVS